MNGECEGHLAAEKNLENHPNQFFALGGHALPATECRRSTH